ncbi:DUF5004 domain-containing protein [Bacteroidales bacterium OttesenSCG-928-I14]|nr:DUF5004 domain-containing protein [Bacteroidales bacterium OttesenSCG-928-I14]
MKNKLLIALAILTASLVFYSCDEFRDNDNKDYAETPKNINGVWQLTKVSRNFIDITKTMDFSQFRIDLNEDGTYSLENYLPFAVKQDGKWEVDDPLYPFHLKFYEGENNEPVVVSINYPIVEGRRILSITLSPGCYSNSYEYVFTKVEND